MKQIVKTLLAVAIAFAALGQYSSARALEMFKFRGLGVNASFYRVDGCVETRVDVFTAEASIQVFPGNMDPFSSVNIFISQLDLCNEVQLLAAEGVADLSEADLQISSRLDSATLNTTVTVLDSVNGNSFHVFIDLNWMGIGDPTRERTNFHFKEQTCLFHSRFKGTFRAAEVTGSVSDGTTNFTPEPSLSGLLVSSNSAEMRVHCS